MEVLWSYDVRFSPDIQTMVDDHLILPGLSSVTTSMDVQQRLNQPCGELELDPEMILIFRKSMTWNVLRELFDKLQVFLKPILPYLDFLVYFHLHNSEMFNKQLFFRKNKLSGSQGDGDASVTVNLTADIDSSSTDHTEKLMEVT